MPQARSSGSKSASTSGRSQTKRATAAKSTGTRAAKSTGAKRTTRKTASAASAGSKTRATKSASSRSTSARSSARPANGATAADPRLEAVAQRVRKLNEKIIEEGKAAGEATLSSYEKALKAIASTLERGPGTSDVEWIASLATTQAKFIRDVTTAWTAAARGVLK